VFYKIYSKNFFVGLDIWGGVGVKQWYKKDIEEIQRNT
jgi:hypothetical protein